jgi:MoaA/NifB/PqqE/SkfB family radical SAM enzyme
MKALAPDAAPAAPPDPRRYFECIGEQRSPVAANDPVCLYLETTNRCNLLCETCPRTFEELEPPADMSWELFTSIVDQYPNIQRVVLHGVGEPMMVAELPAMVRYLKARGTYVLFNTNGTLMREKKGRELIAAGLDELRISLDAAEPKAFAVVRGRDLFDRIVRNVKNFVAWQKEMQAEKPRLSLWLTGLRETMQQLPAFIRLAHEIGVPEVHLQRLVFPDGGFGLARPESSLFERLDDEDGAYLLAAEQLAAELGVLFDASGAAEPEVSLRRSESDSPWSLCRRPWSLMYFTAHGRALPCCIAPFSMRGYENFTLGDARTATLPEIWNSAAYQAFRTDLLSNTPPKPCEGCGLRWSL